jgi:TRAP-type transport system small permease protein
MSDTPVGLPPSEGGPVGIVANEYRSRFERFADVLANVSVWTAMGVILLMMVLITVDMLLRNLAGRSLLVVEEVVGQLTVATAFLGIPYALRRHALLRVELLRNQLSAKAGAVVDIAFTLASILYIGIVIWFGVRLVSSSLRLKIVSLSYLQTPMWIPQLVIPVGGSLLLLALLAELLRDTRRLKTIWQ